MYKHILMSTDGSELALKGVKHGLALAKKCGSKVTVITVSQPHPQQSAPTTDSWAHAQQAHADSTLVAVWDAAKAAGVEVTARQITDKSPAEAIVEAAESQGCDLIVMASHGRRGVSRLLLGSQTTEVVSHSPVPVLVVR